MPIRIFDFGVLHRNEISGALSGLTRVRKFHQDDAHLFCTQDQIEELIIENINLLQYFYDLFGFKYVLQLSTKPKIYIGDDAIWEKAESQLSEALNKMGLPWKINPEDGAFYGPKIDIVVFDSFQ